MKEILDEIKDLESLLTDRISENYDVKGMQQCRHAYLYYRSIVWNIRLKVSKLFSCDDIEKHLNICLNKAIAQNKLKGKTSNDIAIFIKEYIEENKLK